MLNLSKNTAHIIAAIYPPVGGIHNAEPIESAFAIVLFPMSAHGHPESCVSKNALCRIDWIGCRTSWPANQLGMRRGDDGFGSSRLFFCHRSGNHMAVQKSTEKI